MQENDGRLSGDELVELDHEENESAQDANDSGIDEKSTGDELAGPDDEGGESAQDEDGSGIDEKFTRDDLTGPDDEGGESVQDEDDSKKLKKKDNGGKRSLLFITLGLCLLAGTGFLYVRWKNSDFTLVNKEVTPPAHRYEIPKKRLFILGSFVIPYLEKKEFTYISLSISFSLPNKGLKREMFKNKNQIRGIIYDLLKVEINKIKEVPSIEKLKEFIIKGVNKVLSAGKVTEVYVTQFLAV